MRASQLVLLLLPIIAIQVVLMILALIDLFKRKKVTGGNKIIWGLVIVLINFIGPILYLVIGRKED